MDPDTPVSGPPFRGGPSCSGGQTRKAVSTLLGDFRPSPDLDDLLRDWGRRTFGPGALEDLTKGKWHFATVSIRPAYLTQEDSDDVPYSPDHGDTREEVYRAIRARRGQQPFRQQLMDTHERRCVVSGCQLQDVLEAAHISPYRGEEDHHPSNGLLLRADLHTLFDLDLLGIHPDARTVHFKKSAKAEHRDLDGKPLKTTATLSREALVERWRRFNERRRQG